MKSQGLKILLLLILYSSLLDVLSQTVSFEIEIGKPDSDVSSAEFIQDRNNCFVGSMNYSVYENGFLMKKYPRVFKITPSGDSLSVNFAKKDTLFYYVEIIEVNDEENGYLLNGKAYIAGGSSNYAFHVFTRLDTDLNVLWEKIYDFGLFYAGPSSQIMQLSDCNFLFACSPQTGVKMFLLKLSKQGDSLDYVCYQGDSAGGVYGLTYNFDSTAIWLHTHHAHFQPGVQSNNRITINDQLEQTEVYYYPDWFRIPYTAKLLDSNRLLAGGSKYIVDNGMNWHIGAFILDSELNTVYFNDLTDPDTLTKAPYLRTVDFVDPSRIYAGGIFNTNYYIGYEPTWYYVSQLDDTLGIVWERYIGGDAFYYLQCLTATDDGGVLLSGMKYELGIDPVLHDAYLVKLDGGGTTGGDIGENQVQIKDAILYPNPGRDYLNVRTALKGCSLYIYDAGGNLLQNKPLNNHITTLNTTNYTAGSYFYQIIQNERIVESGNWIKY